MAAIARIRLGLGEYEFWRLTPRQFLAYMEEWTECERRHWARFRFNATACARAAGHDVNYMEEPPEDREADPEVFMAWLKSKAEKSAPSAGHGEELRTEG